jgi:DNA-binding LacI/PurR family transcriptional regulator
MTERPTLQSVAKAAGVSPMTVSNAFNRPDQCSAETREKVLAVARELGYAGPDPAARSLRRGRTDTVGVLLTERLPYAFTDLGMVAFLHGLATALADAGQALLLLPAEGNAEHAHVRNALVDAFVLASLLPDDPAVADVLDRRLPVVSWGQPRLPGVPRIGVDNARAAAKAARHLLDLGHRRFLVVTFGADTVAARAAGTADAGHDEHTSAVRGVHRAMAERVAGFTRELRTAGVSDVRIVNAAKNARSAGVDAIASSLENPTATAVFAVTDVLALGVLDAAAAKQVPVPSRLSVVGFDDVAAAASSVPPLTTVSQSLFDQGGLAAKAILDQLAGREPKTRPIPSELIVRGSTAAAPRQAGRRTR